MRWSILLLPLLVFTTVACGGDDSDWDTGTGWGQPSGDPVDTTGITTPEPNTNPYIPTSNPYANPNYTDPANTDPVNTDPVNTDPVIPASTSNANTLKLTTVEGQFWTNPLCSLYDWRTIGLTFVPWTTAFRAVKLAKMSTVANRVVQVGRWGTVSTVAAWEMASCNLKVEVTFDHNGQPLTKSTKFNVYPGIDATAMSTPVSFAPAGGVVGKTITARVFDQDNYGVTMVDMEIGVCTSAPITGENVDARSIDVACEFKKFAWLEDGVSTGATSLGESSSGLDLSPISAILHFELK